MNLNNLYTNGSALRITAIVDHLVRHFSIQPYAGDLILVLGQGTEGSPREALRHWVVNQCRDLVDQDPEFPLKAIEWRLFDHLQAHGYNPCDIELLSPIASRLRAPLPDPDRDQALAHQLKARIND